MTVVIHNPSTIDVNQAIIAVPHGNFEVINGVTGHPLQAYVACHQDYDINDDQILSCFLHAQLETKAWEVSVIKLRENLDVDLRLLSEKKQLLDTKLKSNFSDVTL